jgi:predicted MFS family arabinose efflux permease
MGQMGTVESIVGVVVALLMGVISLRVRYKPLVVTGLACLALSAVGCSLAPDVRAMVLCYAMTGVGASMVLPITDTLVGALFPSDRRSRVVGWLIAGSSLAFLVGAPVIAAVSDLGGWRLPFLVFAGPVALAGLLVAMTGLPASPSPPASRRPARVVEGFTAILADRSALTCIVGMLLVTAGYQAVLFYASPFYIQRFQLSTGWASMTIFGRAFCFTVGSLVSGRLVDRYGRKPVVAGCAAVAGLTVMAYTNLPALWLSVASTLVGSLCTSLAFSALSSLTLEQVPRFRGTVMSITAAVGSVGAALGTAVGGWVLLVADYAFVGLALGILLLVAAVTTHLVAVDPTR